jgi:hypothetical protein
MAYWSIQFVTCMLASKLNKSACSMAQAFRAGQL